MFRNLPCRRTQKSRWASSKCTKAKRLRRKQQGRRGLRTNETKRKRLERRCDEIAASKEIISFSLDPPKVFLTHCFVCSFYRSYSFQWSRQGLRSRPDGIRVRLLEHGRWRFDSKRIPWLETNEGGGWVCFAFAPIRFDSIRFRFSRSRFISFSFAWIVCSCLRFCLLSHLLLTFSYHCWSYFEP